MSEASSQNPFALATRQIAFAYDAQTVDGRAMRGTIDAANLDDAMEQLQLMGLRVTSASAVFDGSGNENSVTINGGATTHASDRRAPRGPLGADDFRAFNDQLAHLAAAGLPIEHGLRLVAKDLRHGKLANTVRAVADELDRGTPLPDAIERYRGQFPPLYARLIEAGIRTGDLSSALLNIGRHVDTVQRLRRNLWQASAYPLMITIALLVVLLILSAFVFPQFEQMYLGFGHVNARPIYRGWQMPDQADTFALPFLTTVLFRVARFASILLLVLLALLILVPLAWRMIASSALRARVTDSLLVRLPLIGPAIKTSLLARWCDALRLGVNSGLDLPASLALAADTIDSPRLRADTHLLISAVERGRPLDAANEPRPRMLPAVVAPMIELAARGNDLPSALRALADLFQRQADARVRAIPAVLTPVLMAIIASAIAIVLLGLLLPLARMLNYLTNGLL